MGFSYGFREKRSQHNALDALYIGMSRCKINYNIDIPKSMRYSKHIFKGDRRKLSALADVQRRYEAGEPW
jgi:hypothetical protein